MLIHSLISGPPTPCTRWVVGESA
eukprot:COSAG01_NODE_16439_length_1236_cov_2.543536_4_plen_23_part_01